MRENCADQFIARPDMYLIFFGSLPSLARRFFPLIPLGTCSYLPLVPKDPRSIGMRTWAERGEAEQGTRISKVSLAIFMQDNSHSSSTFVWVKECCFLLIINRQVYFSFQIQEDFAIGAFFFLQSWGYPMSRYTPKMSWPVLYMKGTQVPCRISSSGSICWLRFCLGHSIFWVQ